MQRRASTKSCKRLEERGSAAFSIPQKAGETLLSAHRAGIQSQALSPAHLVNVISVDSAAIEADLIVLSLIAAVWPRKTMRTKPLRNLLEKC
jgi:hypothetical protein